MLGLERFQHRRGRWQHSIAVHVERHECSSPVKNCRTEQTSSKTPPSTALSTAGIKHPFAKLELPYCYVLTRP